MEDWLVRFSRALALTLTALVTTPTSLTFSVSSAGWGHISKPLFSKRMFPKSPHVLCQLSLSPLVRYPSVEKQGLSLKPGLLVEDCETSQVV